MRNMTSLWSVQIEHLTLLLSVWMNITIKLLGLLQISVILVITPLLSLSYYFIDEGQRGKFSFLSFTAFPLFPLIDEPREISLSLTFALCLSLSLSLSVLNQAKCFPLVSVETGCASLRFMVYFHCQKHRGWPRALQASIVLMKKTLYNQLVSNYCYNTE